MPSPRHFPAQPGSLRSGTVTKSPFLFPIQLPPLSQDVGGGYSALCVFETHCAETLSRRVHSFVK